eukprot:g2624.t1
MRCLVLSVFLLACCVQGRLFKPYAATVHIVNVMGEDAKFGACSSGLSAAIAEHPKMDELPQL